jgi:hypothetical protein
VVQGIGPEFKHQHCKKKKKKRKKKNKTGAVNFAQVVDHQSSNPSTTWDWLSPVSGFLCHRVITFTIVYSSAIGISLEPSRNWHLDFQKCELNKFVFFINYPALVFCYSNGKWIHQLNKQTKKTSGMCTDLGSIPSTRQNSKQINKKTEWANTR